MDAATPETKRVEVLLFGPQAELAGVRSVGIDIAAGRTTCAEALSLVAERCAALRPSIASSRLAVDHAFADGCAVLRGDEELALIGMVGGG